MCVKLKGVSSSCIGSVMRNSISGGSLSPDPIQSVERAEHAARWWKNYGKFLHTIIFRDGGKAWANSVLSSRSGPVRKRLRCLRSIPSPRVNASLQTRRLELAASTSRGFVETKSPAELSAAGRDCLERLSRTRNEVHRPTLGRASDSEAPSRLAPRPIVLAGV